MCRRRDTLERICCPNAPIGNAIRCEYAAHEYGRATAPNSRLNEISGYSRLNDFFDAELDVIESLPSNHSVRQLRIVPKFLNGCERPVPISFIQNNRTAILFMVINRGLQSRDRVVDIFERRV